MEYEVIIVGAGVQGSATAYYLASRGTKSVLLIEQFSSLHTRGSSHGGSRVTRRAYTEGIYVKMMDESFRMWGQIERESGFQIYWKTGMYVVGEMGHEQMKKYITPMEENGIAYKCCSGEEVMEKYSGLIKFPKGYEGIYEDDSGILKADKAVQTMQKLFEKHGGKILNECKVTGIVPEPVVTVKTDKGNFKAKSLILTTGAWTNSLLDDAGISLNLDIRPLDAHAIYWKVADPISYSVEEGFPVFTIYNSAGRFCYNCPVFEKPGLMKICSHPMPGHGRDIVDLNKREPFPPPDELEDLKKLINDHFIGIDKEPAIVEPCMYSCTPDTNPFMDRHPHHPNIVIGAGFSGHGFKLAPVVGKILSELALGLTPSYNMSAFRIGRF